jgi:recombinational DNA repair ATPase RecF
VYRLQLDHFRCFEHAQIDLGPMTLLIGPNASGKTSVLNAVELLSNARYPVDVVPSLIQALARYSDLQKGFKEPEKSRLSLFKHLHPFTVKRAPN